ncbi:threonine-phosphate decarboxylase CobD [Paenibacillus protaetiae]|uniref:threonine-phosphate decarboxylase n=1 Tax=Paenibacillus protaetiae TaxID=2509456 RepID=A0A4V0YFN6_9BACL|nr:threonine-phosphate decarboxylase CobD [Paenibacillus protaetiae]QAY68341.1 threonine-phosphate decarboxylase [Paenibacillus protaetiae]
MLEKYGHGGDLLTASSAYGLPEEQFLDFSSNMNPLGPPPAVREELLRYADRIMHYPDPAVRRLRAKLAAKHGIRAESILAGNGAAELIDLVVRAIKPAKAGIAIPSFGEYGDALRKHGSGIIPVLLKPENGFALDEAAISDSRELAEADLYIIGSPNNPTGRLVRPELLLALAEQGKTVVVDEAFIDFLPDETSHTLIREAEKRLNLLVIRSMTKFYAIPGIRLGYIAGHPERIAQLQQLQIPWSVNSLAQRIGEAVLDDETFAQRSIRWLQQERPWLESRLRGLGASVYPGAANYLLVRLPDWKGLTAASLQQAMGKQGVLIRDASRFEGLDSRYVRVAVKQRPDNERLLAAFKLAMQQIAGDRSD